MKKSTTHQYNQVMLHTCKDMRELADNVVNLTVTSPPYWNSIDYTSHNIDNSREYRTRKGNSYQDYLGFLQSVFSEVMRVHKEGSICAVVIGTVIYNGVHTPLPFHFVSLMEKLGWWFHQDIIWSKCTGGVKRFSSAARNPFPGYFYPNIMTEYILLFKKPGAYKIFHERSKEEKEHHRIELDSVTTKDVANNIWHIAPVPPKQLDHPCPFPEEIPYRLIRWYTYEGDVVLDPFCGVGTTLKVARNLNRHWMGYEVYKKYVNIAKKRVKEPLTLRTQLVVNYEKLDYGIKQPPKAKPRKRFRK